MNHIKLLLVEDNLIDQMSFKRFVKRENLPYDYTIADSIAQAQEILANVKNFDLILLDHALGDGTGFDLFGSIPNTTPVIFVTGAGNEEIAVRAIKQGASDYIIKDLEGDYLKKLLPLAIINTIKAKMVEKKRFEQSQEIANVGTWEWNIKTDELYWSEQISVLLGYKAGALTTHYDNFIAAIHPDDIDLVETTTHKSIREKSEYNIQFRVIWPDKSIHWLEEKGATIYDDAGNASLMLGMTNDITKIKKIETELREAKQEAERANKVKSEFLSSMSHELRTPLNAILGFGQLLISDEDEPLTSEQRDNMEQIMQGGKYLLELINDILDLAKIEAGKVDLSLEAISVNNLLNESLTLIKPITEKYKTKLHNHSNLEDNIFIHADYLRTKQVLLNLLSNAAKYNHQNGNIHIKTNLENEATLKITITDNGNGISKEKQQKLFEPFNRLGLENSKIEGTGIGLMVCKGLVEQMQGRIGFESEVDKGSSFWFTLPLSKQNKITDDNKTNTKTLLTLPQINARLLYVEDSTPNLKLMGMLVSRIKGLSLITAKTAKEAITLAENNQPDMIIMDTELSDNSGIEAIQQLKNNPLTHAIPVFALCTNETHEHIKKINLGIDEYLSKPINVSQILKGVYGVLENKS